MINSNNLKPKILVIGDLMIDHYIWGTCNRVSPEAPVQVIDVVEESSVLGGAGNVINNLQALGATVDIISVIGDCEFSEELKELIRKIKINTSFIFKQKNRITSKKSRVISSQQQVIRFDKETTVEIELNSQRKILKVFKKIVKDYDCVLLSDYGKGVLTFNLTQSIITIAKKNQKKVLIDPKGLDYSKYDGAYLITPNKKEASEASKINISDQQSLKLAIKKLRKEFNLDVSIITLSEEGIAIFDNELRIHPTAAREVYDVTGAGDTVLASLGYALSCNVEIDEAVHFANLASGVVVGKIGSATASLNEIISYESSLNKSKSDKKIKNFSEIKLVVDDLKKLNKKIVFTNGCFDILHLGHIKYLEESRDFGDILIVGLNSDSSIRKIKGDGRPINAQDERAYIIASLGVIDYVVIFDDETPLKLIELIQPDTLVKGSDYSEKYIAGHELVEELKLVTFIDNFSTTKIIERIKNL